MRGQNLKIALALASLLGMALSGPAATTAGNTAPEEGVALAIVYDTSGSMKENVRDANGKPTPKFVIANRALNAVIDRLQAYATNAPADAPRRIQTGLYIFSGERAVPAVPFGAFDPEALRRWMKQFAGPDGGTPLGTALQVASRAVLKSPLNHKHVLVITDGINTLGEDPAKVMPGLNREADRLSTMVFTYFIAFDVKASVFEPVKKLGAMVVGAADEKQLNEQIEFILEQKVLLEAEDPKKAEPNKK